MFAVFKLITQLRIEAGRKQVVPKARSVLIKERCVRGSSWLGSNNSSLEKDRIHPRMILPPSKALLSMSPNFLRLLYIEGRTGDGMFKADLAVRNANLGFAKDINER